MSMEDVDNIMSELGLQEKKTGTSDVDALMAEIGISANKSGGRGLSSGPGRGSSGPGRGGIPPAMMGRGGGVPLAKTTPDGRPINFQGPPCATCGEMIIGPCVNALGKTFHPEHFVCTNCNNPFPNGAFVEHEGKAYCEFDYNQLFCPRCFSCQQPIVDKCVTANNKQFHPHHFNCTGCGKNLVGQSYKIDESDIFCTNCKLAKLQRLAPEAEPCARCKLPITGEYVILNGQKMHSEHFRCEACGCEFKGGNSHEWEGKLYCTEDYNKLHRNVCASCHKPIVGRSITALSRVWHPEHFVCFVCHEPFSGSNFYEHDNKPYCEIHFAQAFGKPCNKCNKPVVKEVINFFDRVYHPGCFVCTGCDKPLKKGDITEWESKPMCMGCYSKLPKEVRKKYEKKKEAEKKAAEQKAKEEKKAQKSAEKKS